MPLLAGGALRLARYGARVDPVARTGAGPRLYDGAHGVRRRGTSGVDCEASDEVRTLCSHGAPCLCVAEAVRPQFEFIILCSRVVNLHQILCQAHSVSSEHAAAPLIWELTSSNWESSSTV